LEVADRGPVDCEPLGALAPDQAPEALQEVALAEVQFNVALLPLATALGPALRLTVGAGDLTETVADCAALPPAPLQVRVYVALASTAPVDREPLVGWLPDQAPEAVQEVALTDFQLNVAMPPLLTVLGATLNAVLGAAPATVIVVDWVAWPPGPVQVSVYVELTLIAPVLCEPLTLLLPAQLPEAVHDVAFWLVQEIEEEPPD
jgi:hypothetical protein